MCSSDACLQPARSSFRPRLQIRAEVERLGVQEGFVNVLSRHTTTAGAAGCCGGCLGLTRPGARSVHPTGTTGCYLLP